MNGESAFGWAKVVALVIALVIIGFVIYEIIALLKKFGGKAADVAKVAAAKVEDTRQSAGSTVADWFESIFMRGTDAQINAMKKGVGGKPQGALDTDIYVGDLPLGDIAVNPRDAR